MYQDLVKLALVGLSAGLCLSAQTNAAGVNQEIAMSKCTRTPNAQNDTDQSSCGGNSDNNSCANTCSGNGASGDQGQNQNAQQTSSMERKRKSAAQKVIESEKG